MKKPHCRLCLKETKLQEKSHIIPEFIYGSLFDQHHKLFKIFPSDYVNGNRKVFRQASGEYDSYILCKECDTITLNQYETYAKDVVARTHSRILLDGCDDETTPEGVKFRRCNNVDYRRFKLFLISILWRASISTREMFREVKIGADHEETIRSMILKGDPGREDEYPVLMISYLGDTSVPGDLVGQPGISPIDGKPRFIFPIAGVAYIFHIVEDAVPAGMRPYTLRDINQAKLLYTPKGMAWNLIMNYFNVKLS